MILSKKILTLIAPFKQHGFQLITFAMVGFCATATHYFTALLLIEKFSLGIQLANFCGFWAAFSVSYLGQSIYTFKSRPNLANLIKYLILAISNFFVSALLLQFLTSLFTWNHRISLLIVVLVLPLLSYFISKKFIFSK